MLEKQPPTPPERAEWLRLAQESRRRDCGCLPAGPQAATLAEAVVWLDKQVTAKDDEIAALREMLKAADKLRASGYWGAKTCRAVMAYDAARAEVPEEASDAVTGCGDK